MWGFSCLPRRKFSLRSCLHKVYSVSHVPTYLKRAPVKLFFFPCSYGDRSPIGQLGRIFAVGWVLTGLVIIAITVAALTTALTEITAHSKTTIYGSKVATTRFNKDWSLFVTWRSGGGEFYLEGSHSFQGGREGINLRQQRILGELWKVDGQWGVTNFIMAQPNPLFSSLRRQLWRSLVHAREN